MATTTKCMSKMNKKELYEFCKILVDENKKLQLFNNTQMEDIEALKKDEKTTECICNMDIKIKMLETQNEELKTKQEIVLKQNDILLKSNEDMGERISELEEHLEYFQNKCECQERHIILIEDKIYEKFKSEIKDDILGSEYKKLKDKYEKLNKLYKQNVKEINSLKENIIERELELSEDNEDFICVTCNKPISMDPVDYKCSEGECLECQKHA